MILLVACCLVLWFVLSRSKYWAGLDSRAAARLVKTASACFLLFAAAVIFLKGHAEFALLMLGGGLWLFNAANRAPKSEAAGSARPAISRVRTAMIEMELDQTTGAMSGFVLAGPGEGQRLDQMTRAQCDGVYALCRTADLEGARLLEAYFDRRFPGWRQAGQGYRDAGRGDRARYPNRMSEDEAYQILGLPRGAARDDVVRSHRTLMKKLHPDQGGSTALAARVNEAKEVLMRRHL